MRLVRSLVLALMVLPGCTVGPANPSPAPTLPPQTPAPTPAVSTSPSPLSSPTSPPPHPQSKTAIIIGTITDEDGLAVEDATITVRSLDATVPYEASTTAAKGTYTVNTLPEGLQVEVVATKPGWTSRRRVGAFFARADAQNPVDFGGTAAGAEFFLSSYPEVAATRPTGTGYALTLSEPLDAANRARLQAALRLDRVDSTGLTSNDAPADYQPDRELPPAVVPQAFTWNAAGDQLQVTLLPGGGSFQLYLVAGPERIQDADGHPLGQDALQGWAAVPAGQLLRRVFYRAAAAARAADNASPGARWAAAHFDAVFIAP